MATCPYLQKPYAHLYPGVVLSVPPEGFASVKRLCLTVAAELAGVKALNQTRHWKEEGAELVIQQADLLNRDYRLELSYDDRGRKNAIAILEVPSVAALVEALEAIPDVHGKGRTV